MKLSPSWEAASCAATQELPTILWNPKVHFRAQKSFPLVPIPSQINPIHTTPSYLSKIRLHIVAHRPVAERWLCENNILYLVTAGKQVNNTRPIARQLLGK
jgi:hypothetical protein